MPELNSTLSSGLTRGSKPSAIVDPRVKPEDDVEHEGYLANSRRLCEPILNGIQNDKEQPSHLVALDEMPDGFSLARRTSPPEPPPRVRSFFLRRPVGGSKVMMTFGAR